MRQIIRAVGPKWQLVWQLMQQPIWPQLLAGKKAVMLPDDDVILDTCAINRCLGCLQVGGVASHARAVSTVRHLCSPCAPCTPTFLGRHQPVRPTCLPCRAFELFTAYGLLLGQPSLCPVEHRASWWAQTATPRGCLGVGCQCSTGVLPQTRPGSQAARGGLLSAVLLHMPLPPARPTEQCLQHPACRYLHLVQRPEFTLRFVTMVEIMVGEGHSAAAADVWRSARERNMIAIGG